MTMEMNWYMFTSTPQPIHTLKDNYEPTQSQTTPLGKWYFESL
jgi:hypothetical protein